MKEAAYLQDNEIVELYWQRDEEAIVESDRKYGRYCFAVANRVLSNQQDSEECVNDTWWRTWDAVPPERPLRLMAYFGKITRNLALNRWRNQRTRKRGSGEVELALEELLECVPAGNGSWNRSQDGSPERVIEDKELVRALDTFLGELPVLDRDLFVRRYWAAESMAEIAVRFRMKENAVRTRLFRSRRKLKEYLEAEGIWL